MIGLATPFITNNYGTKLQAFAIQNYLIINGYDCEIINYRFKQKNYNLKKFFLPNRKDYIIIQRRRKEALDSNPDIKEGYSKRNECFSRFVEKYYRLSDRCDTLKDVIDLSSKYSAVICGSDQIWLPSHVFEKYYMLDFLPQRIKKIAYAPSFGISKIPFYVESEYKKSIRNFDVVTVREKKGAELVEQLTGEKCDVVVDPTLLLSSKKWNELLDIKEPVFSEKYVFAYFLGVNEEHRKKAREYADKRQIKLVILPNIGEINDIDNKYADIAPYDIDPAQFVNLIKNAEAVFTDSFHGTVFSLIFQKEVYCFERFNDESKSSTNSRIYSLLQNTGLEDRLVKSDTDISNVGVINYEEVQNRIDTMVEHSANILREALSDI